MKRDSISSTYRYIPIRNSRLISNEPILLSGVDEKLMELLPTENIATDQQQPQQTQPDKKKKAAVFRVLKRVADFVWDFVASRRRRQHN